MGKRGPKPKPTAVQRTRGNPGKRSLNNGEPQPAGKLPAAPKHLSGEARKAWTAFAKQLTEAGIATRIDAVALELLCASYATYLEAAENVRQYGPIWMDQPEKGKIPKFVYSPHWVVMNRAWKEVKQMLGEFGMTPSSRTGVRAAPQADENPFAQFMRS